MITIAHLKTSYPITFMRFAKYLHTTLSKEDYAVFTKQHPYVVYMYLLSFLSTEGFDSTAEMCNYHKIGIDLNPVGTIESVIEKGLYFVEQDNTKEEWELK